VHTLDVVVAKLTGRPELAVAVSASGAAVLMICVGMDAKVIVWEARLTVKLRETGVAAA
jgi:hypothetical protein